MVNKKLRERKIRERKRGRAILKGEERRRVWEEERAERRLMERGWKRDQRERDKRVMMRGRARWKG